jgi:hypothetical protein
MKNFKQFMREQKQAEGETTLSPDFLEKKQRRDRQTETRIEKPTEKIISKAEAESERDMEKEIEG